MSFELLRDLASSTVRDDALAWLTSASGAGFEHHRSQVELLIRTHDDIAVRTCRPGHLTGSAFVVDPDRQACLLLFHTKLQRWLQPGGHADGDMNLAHVAWREATEETGIDGLQVVGPPIDVDVHTVDPPAEDAHLHLDVRFLVIAPAGSEPVGNHESQGFRWLRQEQLDGVDLDSGSRRMAAAGFAAAADVFT